MAEVERDTTEGYPSYHTTAGLARRLKAPVDGIAAAAQQMAEVGNDPYVRTADGQIIGQALRTERGWVLNAALTPDAAADIARSEAERSAAPNWNVADRRAAIRDGWDIFETTRDAARPYELQKIDDPSVWPLGERVEQVWDADVDVWEHVVGRAAGGSKLHARALDFLAAHSPAERADIARWVDATPDEAQRRMLRLDYLSQSGPTHDRGVGLD